MQRIAGYRVEKDIKNSDRELFLQIAGGDELAFGSLFRRFGPRLHSYLTDITRSRDTAEELVQNIFIRIWLNRDKLITIQNVNAWIYKVASNEAYNFLEHRAVEKKATDLLNHQQPNDYHQDEILYREMKNAIQQAVNSLSRRRKQVYQLSREKGLKQQQIADELGISVITVKNILGEALKGIRIYLEHRGLLMLAVFFLIGEK